MRDFAILRSLSLKNDFRPLVALAIPLVISGVFQSSLGFVETIFLAHLSEEVLAAGALVAWFFFTLINLLFGLFNAINILVALKYGAKDHVGISHVVRDGLVLGFLLALPTFFLLWTMAPIFLWFGQKPELVSLARLYLQALAWGILPKFILIVLYEFLIGLGHTRLTMVVNILAIPLYLFFSYVLIFGKWGFPALGIAGAGWGMSIGDWITAFILCIYLVCSKKYWSYLRAIFIFKKPYFFSEIFQLGIPLGLMFTVEVGFFFVIMLVMGWISIQSLAANQITMQYLGPLMGLVFCIAQAITVRMGHQIGANQLGMAARTGYAGVILSLIFMLFVTIFYWFTPEMLISVDFNVDNPNNFAIVNIAKEFLFIAAIFQIFESIRVSLFGALRALKETRFMLLVSIISFWGIALPIGYVAAIWLNMGGNAIWWGMVISVFFSTILLYLRFKNRIYSSVSFNSLKG